jgi:predicted dehydrogenase
MSEETKLSRRTMLSAAALGALAVGTGAVRAATDAQPGGAPSGRTAKADATLRWGVIGTGTRGGWTHIPVLKEAPESQTIALCDVSDERLQAAAKRVDHPVATYSDYQKLLANPDVNAVVIAVPNLLHREILQAAIQAGKHVLCEKPAGATPADARAMKQMVDAARTVVMFGMQYRNNPNQQKMAEVVQSGRIGKPRYMVQTCSRGDWNLKPSVWRYSDPKVLGGKPVNWRFSQTASGGTLNEFSCHYLDLLHWYAGGLPERILADGGISVYHDGRDTWDHASVTLLYPDGLTAIHTLCLFGPGRADLTIAGTEGSIETAPKGVLKLTQFSNPGSKGGQRIQEIQVDQPPRHSADHSTLTLYEDFLACVKTGKRPDANVDRAVAASRTCWLAELASDRKAEVKWDEV